MIIINNQKETKSTSLIVFCPTKNRIERFIKMYKSFKETSSIAVLVALLDYDEKYINEYQNYFHNENIPYMIQKLEFSTLTNYINYAFKIFDSQNETQFYSITNDDFVFHTPQWDLKLMKDAFCGIAYGDDKVMGKKLPTMSVVDGDIVRALDWLQMPTLNNLYGDSVWSVIGTRLNILKYNPDVVIEHEHYIFNENIKKDSTYEKTNSREAYDKDGKAFKQWLRQQINKDCETIKAVLNDRQ